MQRNARNATHRRKACTHTQVYTHARAQDSPELSPGPSEGTQSYSEGTQSYTHALLGQALAFIHGNTSDISPIDSQGDSSSLGSAVSDVGGSQDEWDEWIQCAQDSTPHSITPRPEPCEQLGLLLNPMTSLDRLSAQELQDTFMCVTPLAHTLTRMHARSIARSIVQVCACACCARDNAIHQSFQSSNAAN